MARDISPYSCIFDNCSTPDEMYVTSNDLLQHFKTEHSVRCWICDHCSMQTSDPASFIFGTSDEWDEHMDRFHHDMFLKTQSVALSELSNRTMLPPMSCPLCGYSTSYPSAALDDHIVQHLHSFALTSLPWGLDEDGLSHQASEAQSTRKTNISVLSDEKGEPALKDQREAKITTQLAEDHQKDTETSISMRPPEGTTRSLKAQLQSCFLPSVYGTSMQFEFIQSVFSYHRDRAPHSSRSTSPF